MVETATEKIEESGPTVSKSRENPVRLERYAEENRTEWNEFVKAAKNGTFLFERDYMEYHADRFTDCSLLFRDENGKLLAVMPASQKDNLLVSHGGLTYGGIVSGNRMRTSQMLAIFEGLIRFARENNFRQIVYKAVPHIYHQQPAEEDLYALFRFDARLVRRDVSTSVLSSERLPLSKGRKWATAQSRKSGVEIRQSEDFETFMQLEAEILAAKYKAVPVHTAAEIQLLAKRFPENIKLFTASQNDKMLAGVIIYETATVAHAQYIAAADEGKEVFALDAVLYHLIADCYAAKKYFDFGISTERQGRYLNAGLIDFKESWGGRAVCYDTYEITLS